MWVFGSIVGPDYFGPAQQNRPIPYLKSGLSLFESGFTLFLTASTAVLGPVEYTPAVASLLTLHTTTLYSLSTDHR